jgi:uncharacterized protein (TIGR02996 family)
LPTGSRLIGAGSEAAALLWAVLLAPDDEAPRLIFADWLEEHGEPDRAKVIRWMVRVPSYRFFWNQSRWAKRPKHKHAEAIKAIRGLKPRLSVLCQEEWALYRGVEQVVMRRGFAEAVTLPAYVFLSSAAELFSLHPFQDVLLSDLHPRPAWTPAHEQLERRVVLPRRAPAEQFSVRDPLVGGGVGRVQ